MGLDMYLTKKTYVKNWEHTPSNELHNIIIQKGNKIRNDIKTDRICYVEEEICYWRKANQIHNWFVSNCGNGDDNCQPMYVSKEQLKELVALCKQVIEGSKLVDGKVVIGQVSTQNGWENEYADGKYIENPELAQELLPTVDGFFFGSTEYDQYYIDDLKHTVKVLEEELKNSSDDNTDYYYQASW